MNAKQDLRKVDMEQYQLEPNSYELRSGIEPNAPLCPFGNHYQWTGFDLERNEYVRFTKSVFKLLVNKITVKDEHEN